MHREATTLAGDPPTGRPPADRTALRPCSPGPTIGRWRIDVTVSAEASFTSFVERVGRPLRQALIAAYGPDVGVDVAADALAYAWEHWDRVSAMGNPAGYLYRVGQSSARRGIFRRPPAYERPRLPDGSVWVEPELEGAMAALSRQQRAAITLVHGYGWKITEVAELWGVAFSTVRAHLDRGMSKLRARLGVDG
jgi:DNA-directed RNA polymerase specialized sigma24 family protein